MHISLTPELSRFIQTRLATGTYRSASEVIRHGLRLLMEEERLRHEAWQNWHASREETEPTLEFPSTGESGQAVIQELRRKLKRRATKGRRAVAS